MSTGWGFSNIAITVSTARQGRAASVCRHVSGGLVQRGEVWWVQFDEPALVTDISPDAPALAEAVYTALGAVSNRPAIHVAT